jgi:tetratricopeptide (TPR) repeat protein
METPQNHELGGHEESQVAKLLNNKKLIYGASIAVVAIVIIAFAWFFIAQSGSRNADEMIAKADMEQNDSIAFNLYKQAAEAGYKSGNRAKVEVAIRLYNNGKYEDAIKYLDDASISDNIVAAGVYSLKGDCYVNLKKNDEAIKCFNKAISKADENPDIVPLVLIKLANVYRAENKFDDEFEAYDKLINEYPQYVQSAQTDIRKYYERAKAAAGK